MIHHTYSLVTAKRWRLALALTVIGVGMGMLPTSKAEAIVINNSNIPVAHQNHLDVDRRMCRPTGSTIAPYGHSQNAWISAGSNPTFVSPIVIMEGTPSVELRWNVLSSHCTVNLSDDINPNSFIEPLGRTIQRTRYNVTGTTTSLGSVSAITSFLDTPYSNTYQTPPNELFYVKETSNPNAVPVHDRFTLSGLGALTPGDHQVQIRITFRHVNRYNVDTTAGTHRCIEPSGIAAVGGLDGTNCGTATAVYNVTLRVQPLTQPVIACNSVSTNPVDLSPGDVFTLNVGWQTSGGSSGQGQINYQTHLTFPGVGINNGLIGQGLIDFSSDSRINQRNNLVINSSGTYSGQYTVTIAAASNSPHTCPFTVEVSTKPYLRLYGGDVLAGAGMISGGVCTPTGTGTAVTDPRFIAFNKGSDLGGAGVNLAVFALGQNQEFASAMMRSISGNRPWPPKGLTFASDGGGFGSIPRSEYGGGVNPSVLTSMCTLDHFASRPSNAQQLASNNFTINPANNTGDYYRLGDLNINPNPASPLDPGDRLTIYVQGNAFLEDNVTYSSAGGYGSNPTAIPSFRIIATGNIYIAPGVARIDGELIAQGNVYTCAQAGWTNSLPNSQQLVSSCGQKLTIYGAVTANRLVPLRTNGTLRNGTRLEAYGSGNLSESIIMSPEVWLRTPSATGTSGQGAYDSITGLPPIL